MHSDGSLALRLLTSMCSFQQLVELPPPVALPHFACQECNITSNSLPKSHPSRITHMRVVTQLLHFVYDFRFTPIPIQMLYLINKNEK